ncbi:Cthe_2314 family HEPN domain-containing protein [Granulicella arctica]|uniref:Cthe-2314-like HEPN domain-containing protein n=1 Tax=Granulicella arctica TaxID=940613 RepID=A0A7Y9THL9_9BACT|nr:hypothetical protein [Granulicella arctica]
MSQLGKIDEHPFVRNALAKGVEIDASLGGSPSMLTSKYDREPDEHEYFLIEVAASMANLLTLCQQLDQIPILIGNHRQTSAMDKAYINRHSLIVYHLENYIIRTQGLLDRVLKLVNSAFHLTNSPQNCRFAVVVQNVKVQVSDVHEPLKKLNKLLARYSGVRNEIVHHHSIKDDALRRLDMYFLLERWEKLSKKEHPIEFQEHIKDTIFEVLWFKKRELMAFNDEMCVVVSLILDKLEPYYRREEHTLELRLSKAKEQIC